MEIVLIVVVAIIVLVALSSLSAAQSSRLSSKERTKLIEEGDWILYGGLATAFALYAIPYWRQGWVRLGVSDFWSWVIAVCGTIALLVIMFGTQKHQAEHWWSKTLSWVLFLAAITGYGLVLVGPHKLLEWLANVGADTMSRL